MKYSIGTVAKLLGLSPEGLRLYERMGILHPQRDPDSGYRYYQRLDLTALLRARAYQAYGFSLHDVQQMLHEEDLDAILPRYQRQQQNLEQEILKKQRELAQLRWVQQEIDRFPDTLGKIWEEERPAMVRMEYMEDEKLILSPRQYETLQAWIALAPLAFSSLRNDWTAVQRQVDICHSGIGLWQEDVEVLELSELAAWGKPVPPCRSLCTVVAVDAQPASCVSYLAHLIEYVEEHGCHVAGDPISASIVSLHRQGRYTRYRKVWLPVR